MFPLFTLLFSLALAQDAEPVEELVPGSAEATAMLLDAVDKPLKRGQAQVVVAEDRSYVRLVSPIRFKKGESDVRKRSAKAIDAAADLLRRHGELRIAIMGYPDLRIPDDTQELLSDARAEAVHTELVGRGVQPSQIYTVGMMSPNPGMSAQEVERRQLRSVELRLLPAMEREAYELVPNKAVIHL